MDAAFEPIVGVSLTPLAVLRAAKGHVLKVMGAGDYGYSGFGEAYFSTVPYGVTKGWKRHARMTMNLVVASGDILFAIRDGRPASATYGNAHYCRLSRENHQRLTVPPGIWMAFRGAARPESILLNIADILHDPLEVENHPLDAFTIDWNCIA